ncbi:MULTISPECIES: NolY [Bradyrhizobium]|uniref:NolY n=2 Tax=Bradyrhizobium quebecense TaxID=2748629 RepID=A0A939LGQ9_9BRAD|nr:MULTISPECIES: NolY [Bradyrhizobium]UFX44234.1 NolY [Bradyrhizobium sp. 41S5]UGA44363.1 NolY [Bradyrhizobium quebecense]UGY00581.1 NolY [Bradyrhizobium quebecense]
MELAPSNSRVQNLKDRIDLQLTILATLVGEDGDALDAIRLLNALTNEMITAELELGQLGETRTSNHDGGARTTHMSGDRGAYYPEDLLVLGRLFDQAVDALPANLRTPANRMKIAKLIFSRATE